ncbi:MAG: AmmeMemoRadiSam system protein B [Candidatus Kappaea frigidicola]|nr:AmmeMemoRadiSam system protein B [Candidatus Kappaea frigidicola]
MIKKPNFAGSFYPEDYTDLSNLLESFAPDEPIHTKPDALGLLLPHAAYFCSGKVAYRTLVNYNLADTIVILGTHHSLSGEPFATSCAEGWQTPFGVASIDTEFVKDIAHKSKYVTIDEKAFYEEHSIEIQVPMLQYLKNKFNFIPILISEAEKETYIAIALDIIKTAKDLNRNITIIASGDLTHYESQTQAEYKDAEAIKAILQLNPEELLIIRDKLHISMCAGAPAYTMLYASKKLGAKEAKLIMYNTSADTTNDFHSVVGYAGIGVS